MFSIKNKPIHNVVSRKNILIKPTFNKRIVKTRISSDVIINTSYLVGKSIILYTMFYCSLNWYHYYNLRKDLEKNDEKDKKK